MKSDLCVAVFRTDRRQWHILSASTRCRYAWSTITNKNESARSILMHIAIGYTTYRLIVLCLLESFTTFPARHFPLYSVWCVDTHAMRFRHFWPTWTIWQPLRATDRDTLVHSPRVFHRQPSIGHLRPLGPWAEYFWWKCRWLRCPNHRRQWIRASSCPALSRRQLCGTNTDPIWVVVASCNNCPHLRSRSLVGWLLCVHCSTTSEHIRLSSMRTWSNSISRHHTNCNWIWSIISCSLSAAIRRPSIRMHCGRQQQELLNFRPDSREIRASSTDNGAVNFAVFQSMSDGTVCSTCSNTMSCSSGIVWHVSSLVTMASPCCPMIVATLRSIAIVRWTLEWSIKMTYCVVCPTYCICCRQS